MATKTAFEVTQSIEDLVDAILARLPDARRIAKNAREPHRYSDFIALLDVFGFPATEEKLRALAAALDATPRTKGEVDD